jgi:hypothetical protein
MTFEMSQSAWLNVDNYLGIIHGAAWEEEDTEQWIFDECGLKHITAYTYEYNDERQVTAFLLRWS